MLPRNSRRLCASSDYYYFQYQSTHEMFVEKGIVFGALQAHDPERSLINDFNVSSSIKATRTIKTCF